MATTRKPPSRRKKVMRDQVIPVRVTAEQKRILIEAADEIGLGVSTWLVMLGLKAAQERSKS